MFLAFEKTILWHKKLHIYVEVKKIHVNLLQSPTNVRKKLFPSYVGLAYSPQLSHCTRLKTESEIWLEETKDKRINLASGQTRQAEVENPRHSERNIIAQNLENFIRNVTKMWMPYISNITCSRILRIRIVIRIKRNKITSMMDTSYRL